MRLSRPTIVLASKSPARKAMLEAAGVEVVLRPVNVDEAALREALAQERAPSKEAAIALAEAKAARAAALGRGDEIVIGADQLLEHRWRWLAKPGSIDEAASQLRELSGTTHRLIAATVAYRRGRRVWSDLGFAVMHMRPLGEAALDAYLAAEGEAVTQSVGGYRIEGVGAQLFASIEGDYHAILGMRLLPLLQFLRDNGAASIP